MKMKKATMKTIKITLSAKAIFSDTIRLSKSSIVDSDGVLSPTVVVKVSI